MRYNRLLFRTSLSLEDHVHVENEFLVREAFFMEKLQFGISGTSKTSGRNDPARKLKEVKDLGLDCFELEFVHGFRLRDEMAESISKTARQLGIDLTSYGPNYINLNAKEQDKIDSSMERIIQTARVSRACGAKSMTFHTAFYMKDDPLDVLDLVEKYLSQIIDRLRFLDINIELRPEMTPKTSQFGTLDELIHLTEKVDHVYPSLDFTSLHARTNDCNGYAAFSRSLEQIKGKLGKDGLQNIHLHVADLKFNSKGDPKLVSLNKGEFRWKELLRALKDYRAKGWVIVQGPSAVEDAKLLKDTYESL
jgi:deoxyribonuclease-4